MPHEIFNHINNVDKFMQYYCECDDSIKPAILVYLVLNNKLEIMQYLPKSADLITLSIIFNKPDMLTILTDGVYTDEQYLTAMYYGRTDIIDLIYKSVGSINAAIMQKFITNSPQNKIICRVVDHIYTKHYIEFDDNISNVLINYVITYCQYDSDIVQYCRNCTNMEKLAYSALIDNNMSMLNYSITNAVCMQSLSKIMNFLKPVRLDMIQLLIANGLCLTKRQICDIICGFRIYEDCIKFLKIMLDNTISEPIYINELNGILYTHLQYEHVYLLDALFKIDYGKNLCFIRSSVFFHWLIDNNYDFSKYYFNDLANIITAYDYIDMYGIEFRFCDSIYAIGRPEFYRLLDYMKINNVYPTNILPMLVYNYITRLELDDSNTYDQIIAAYNIFDNFDKDLVKQKFNSRSRYLYFNIIDNIIFCGNKIMKFIDMYLMDYDWVVLIKSVVDDDYDKFIQYVQHEYTSFMIQIFRLCDHLQRQNFCRYILQNYVIYTDTSKYLDSTALTNVKIFINNLFSGTYAGLSCLETNINNLCQFYPEYITPTIIINNLNKCFLR
jgi:hypothetical protein